MTHTLLRRAGSVEFLLTNEAIVRGAIEAGVSFASAYPGTPASEIGDGFHAVSGESGVRFEYSINEKVAFEAAAAASLSGLRAMTAMKHVGLNVAADPFMTLSYIGVRGGFVIVTADDPSCHSSQNEQDNRIFARFGRYPLLEPSYPQEARDLVLKGYELSEKYKIPVVLRITTRVAHMRGLVKFGEIRRSESRAGFIKDPYNLVVVPSVARRLSPLLHEKMKEMSREAESDNYCIETVSGGSVGAESFRESGIITSGTARNYVREVFSTMPENRMSLLELTMTNPFPEIRVKKFLEAHRRVMAVEELEPFIEDNLHVIAQRNGIRVEITGKRSGHLPFYHELNPAIVRRAITGEPPPAIKKAEAKLPSRPPILCPGCPHRVTYAAVKFVYGESALYASDIGCYTLGLNPPHKMADLLLCMGSSIGIASGLSVSQDKRVVAFIGDSTFFHAGIPALVNAVYHSHRFLLVILDNGTTAMTGFQPHPGAGRNAVEIERLVSGCGIKRCATIDPYDLKGLIRAVRESEGFDGVSVIISKSPCVQMPEIRKVIGGNTPFIVDEGRCRMCGPAMSGRHCGLPFLSSQQRERVLRKIESGKDAASWSDGIREEAPCTASCPAHICAQGYVAHLAAGDFKSAYELLRRRIPFPSVCAYVCHRPCEDACKPLSLESSIAIRELKKAACALGYERDAVKPPEAGNGVRVAVAGAGVAGLACANDLALLGYRVDVFEKEETAGGLLRTGIPGNRLPRDIVDREIRDIAELGVNIVYNKEFNRDFTAESLFAADYGALFVSTGLERSKPLGIEGDELATGAIEFLKLANTSSEFRVNEGKGIVIGGGNAALDAAMMLKNCGVKTVEIFYRRRIQDMPAFREEVESALKSGIRINELCAPIRIVPHDAKAGTHASAGTDSNPRDTDDINFREGGTAIVKIKGVEFVRMSQGETGADGRRKISPIEDSGFFEPADVVIAAIGQESANGFISADEMTMETGIPGVFAGGDVSGGSQTVIDAIAQGKKAAAGIHEFISRRFPGVKRTQESKDRVLSECSQRDASVRGSTADIPEELRAFAGWARLEAGKCSQCGLCANCSACFEFLGCPAMSVRNDKAYIDRSLCNGCALCAVICPNGAISECE